MSSSSSIPPSHLNNQGSIVISVSWAPLYISTSRSFYKDVKSIYYQSLRNVMFITLLRNINLFLYSVLNS